MKFATLAVAALTALPANAVTLTFDNLMSSSQIGAYGGVTFTNFYTLDARTFVPSGYANGVVSRENVAYNGGGQAATIASATPFSLTSAYLAAAWNDGLHVSVTGTLGGTLAFAQTFVVDTTRTRLEFFNRAAVDRVVFTTSGGAPNPDYNLGSGTQMVVDNLTLRPLGANQTAGSVPEPASWAMMAGGLGLVAAAVRRRRHAPDEAIIRPA